MNYSFLFYFSHIFHRYIFSLALADLLVILICVPLASVVYTFESWPWGSTLCRVTESAKDVSIGVSVFTLTALSADRYCAIVNPLRKLQVPNHSITVFSPTSPKCLLMEILLFEIRLQFVFGAHLNVDTTINCYNSRYNMDVGPTLRHTGCNHVRSSSGRSGQRDEPLNLHLLTIRTAWTLHENLC